PDLWAGRRIVASAAATLLCFFAAATTTPAAQTPYRSEVWSSADDPWLRAPAGPDRRARQRPAQAAREGVPPGSPGRLDAADAAGQRRGGPLDRSTGQAALSSDRVRVAGSLSGEGRDLLPFPPQVE